MEYLQNYSLKEYNSFGLNVSTNTFFSFENEEELISFSQNEDFKDKSFFILGGGSNVLFLNDFKGLVLHSEIEDILVLKQDNDSIELRVGSGLEWDKFVEYCVNNRYYGIENLSLIPGNVGAAPVQNIGAYGTEIEEFIMGVWAYDLIKKEKIFLSKDDCHFTYRSSIFKQQTHKSLIITYVDFKLHKKTSYKRRLESYNGNLINKYFQNYKNVLLIAFKALGPLRINIKKMAVSVDYRLLKELFQYSGLISLKKARQIIIDKRNSKIPSPKEIGNVGSFFKNPIVDIKTVQRIRSEYSNIILYPFSPTKVKISAGWLIKMAGCSSLDNPNVGLYKDQTLIIVNKGNATGREIYNYSESIVNSVNEKFGIILEREVVVI